MTDISVDIYSTQDRARDAAAQSVFVAVNSDSDGVLRDVDGNVCGLKVALVDRDGATVHMVLPLEPPTWGTP